MRAWRDFFECRRWHNPLCCHACSAVAGWGSPLPYAHSLTLFCHLQFWAAHAERTLRGFTPYCCSLWLIAYTLWLLPIAVSVHHPNHPPS